MDTTQIPIQKLEIAAKNVEKFSTIDHAAPSLTALMKVSSQVTQTVSGLTDHDYPILSGVPFAANNMPQIKIKSKVPLPPEIMDHFGHVQCHCMMGLFPEINRAWLTVDSDIYIWKYEENSDLAYFDGLNETILCVGLVKPKPGVFHSFIEHLLVLTTAVDIVVLAVTFTSATNDAVDEIQLIPDPVFTIPTDGTTYSTVACTADGRLFLGSREGSIFEISYQAESGWFGKRCKKVNHSTSTFSFLVPSFLNSALSEEDGIIQIAIDNSRHILYALTEKGSIEVYDLGENGTSFGKVIKIAQSTLVNQAVYLVKNLDSQNFRPIVSIAAVELSESLNIYLVAVTKTGIRLYLSTHGLIQNPTKVRPYTLFLLHVRLPPGYSANVTMRPRAVHMSHYKESNALLLSTVNEKDVLWCISSDLFPFGKNFMEAYTTITLDGPALAIAEVPQENDLFNIPQGDSPLVVRQHSQPPKKYVVLTAEAAYVMTKLRPVDVLRQILSDSKGPDGETVKAFFTIQREEQACATSLVIATLDIDENMELAEHATRAFFMYGGEPKVAPVTQQSQPDMLSGTSMFNPNIVSTPTLHFDQQNNSYFPPATHQPNFDVNSPFIFSSKHNGLYIYLGRILKPLWNRRCVEKTVVDSKTLINCSTITSENCRWLLNYLSALHNFLLSNTQLSGLDTTAQPNQTSLNNTTLNATRTGCSLQDAQMEEHRSLEALKMFVCHCCQILGLWRILCEHQFHILIGCLPESQLQVLQNTTFKDLFLYGQDVCSLLITTLVDSYLTDNASVDSISLKLREVCPHLYRIEDAAFSKANEMLKSSRVVQNIDEKEEMLASALQLCKSIAPNINLPAICKQFVTLKAYNAVIDLCITCAKKIDPENIANHYYTNDSAVADQEGQNFYHKRLNIYKEIFNMLDTLCNDNPDMNLTQNINITTSPTVNPADTNENDFRSLINRIIREVLDYPDEILHVALYDWMMTKQMSNELIKINNSSLETYLIHTSQQNSENIQVIDLLWKYYENNNNHAAAAKILDGLSSKTGSSLTLKERIEYLTRAIMCMRSDKIGYAPYLGVFLRDLEDKMEVAKVQEQVLEAVTALKGTNPSADEAIVALNSGLYQITNLYENFAEPFGLWECQLSLIDCAGYMDDNLVEKIWRNILRREVRNGTGNPNNRMSHILAKVKSTARRCGTSSQCFPLVFLINELEQLATYFKCDKSLVPKAFVAMEMPYPTLIDLYNRLISSMGDVQIWQNEENQFHLFEATAALIETFLNNHESSTSSEKRRIISQCQDTVASVLSILYSKPNTEQLINTLRAIQSRLSRL